MTTAGPASRATLALFFVLLAVSAAASVPPVAAETPTATDGSPTHPMEEHPVRIVAVLPNPAAQGDAGEQVVVEFVAPTDVTGWTIADGESAARFPNGTLSGVAIASTEPSAVPPPASNVSVVALSGHLALANAGETIELRDAAGRLVDAVTYEDAPEGRRYVRTDDGWSWRVPGRTDIPVVVARDVPARVFVLPDSPTVPIQTIGAARERVLVGAYTFSSERAVTALCAARSRGVRVAVLVEGEPVGGTSVRSVRALDRLVGCGVDVAALGGPGDRYGVHHPKYAVVDDRALVLSENWKPSGIGGRASRGWGVLVDSARVADALARTFEADAGYRDARPWTAAREGLTPVEEPPANGSFAGQFASEAVLVDRVEVLLAPDNVEGEIVDLVDGAERSVLVQQVAVGSREHPFVEATLRAARRGVSVSVLLSRAWYVREDNRALVEWLNGLAREEGLPIEARLVTPRSGFEKTHVKGVIVDGESAVVGSVNWNAYATRENREVAVVLHDREAAAYYERVFRADWRGGVWRLPVGVGLAAALAGGAAAVWIGRTVRFDGSGGEAGTVGHEASTAGDPW